MGRRPEEFHATSAHALVDYDVAYFIAWDDSDPNGYEPRWIDEPRAGNTPFVVDLRRWRPTGDLSYLAEPPPEGECWSYADRNVSRVYGPGADLDDQFEYRAGRLSLAADRFARRREKRKARRRISEPWEEARDWRGRSVSYSTIADRGFDPAD